MRTDSLHGDGDSGTEYLGHSLVLLFCVVSLDVF